MTFYGACNEADELEHQLPKNEFFLYYICGKWKGDSTEWKFNRDKSGYVAVDTIPTQRPFKYDINDKMLLSIMFENALPNKVHDAFLYYLVLNVTRKDMSWKTYDNDTIKLYRADYEDR